MQSKTSLAWAVVCALALSACSETPDTMVSPSAVSIESTAVNPDGSTLKVGAPSNLTPINAVQIDTVRPTLTFTNATGVFAPVGLAYEVQVQNANGGVVYERIIGESQGSSAHTLETDLTHADNFWWRVRGRLGDRVGPWSGYAEFRTPDPPPPPAPAVAEGGSLPFFVPPVCTAGDGAACVVAMTEFSPWWGACRAGSGVNCHRFTRSVAAALATGDPRWGLITKNPGEQQCTWNWCGPGGGEGYGEDVVAYSTGGGNWFGFDVVGGAGAPGANAGWSRLSSRRAGNNWAPVPAFP